MTNDARERRERTNAENVRPERPPKRPPKLAETPHDLRLAMEVRDSITWRTGTGDNRVWDRVWDRQQRAATVGEACARWVWGVCLRFLAQDCGLNPKQPWFY